MYSLMYFNSMLIRLLFKPSAYNTWHVVLFIVQSLSWLCLTLCDPMESARKASLSFTISQNLFKLMSIETVMPSNHLILCHPLFLLPSIFSSIKIFSNELALQIRWPKSWSFSLSPSSKYSGLISFRIDWFDLLAAQGTLRSLRQYQGLKASILMGISYKWNHIICSLLCVVSFIAYDF